MISEQNYFIIDTAIRELGILGLLSVIYDVLEDNPELLVSYPKIRNLLSNSINNIIIQATADGELDKIEFSAARKAERLNQYGVISLQDRGV